MDPAYQGALLPDFGDPFQLEQTWHQFSPDFQFQLAATDVPCQFNAASGGAGAGYQRTPVDPPPLHSQCYYSGSLYPQPQPMTAGFVSPQQVQPMLAAQQQQQRSVRWQMVQQDSGSVQCKPPFEWTPELHQKFMKAVLELGGLDKAKPVGILRKMSGYGLSRLTVKSHLQTCRRKKKAVEAAGIMITGSDKHESDVEIREQDHVQHETASESLANNYDSELENKTWSSPLAESLKFMEDGTIVEVTQHGRKGTVCEAISGMSEEGKSKPSTDTNGFWPYGDPEW